MSSITTNRQRYQSRVREDAQTWRDRIIGKRIVTSDPDVASYLCWKEPDANTWEPRVYFCARIGEGFDKDIAYSTQAASPLLSLPAEIRIHILEYVLTPQILTPGTDTFYQQNITWMNTSAVIFCCKQLYAEGRALAVKLHTYEYERFPKRTRLCALPRDGDYVWDL